MKTKVSASVEEKIFQRSQWIWPGWYHWDLLNLYALFRKEFTLDAVPKKAPFFITADQAYRLFINGRFVGRGPARGFQHSWPYDEIDVSAYLRPGRNVIAIRVFNPGHSTFQYLSQGFAGLLVSAHWGKTEVVTDGSWRLIRQASVDRDTLPTTVQLFAQEHIDLRQEGEWIEPDFDDSAWPFPHGNAEKPADPTAPVGRPWNSAPWFALEPRGIPLLEEKEIVPAALIGVGEGTSAETAERTRDVIALRQREDRSHRPTDLPFTPLQVQAAGPGKFRSYLFDFKRTVVGSLIFDVEGAHGGEIVDTHLCETIDKVTLTPDQVIPTHSRIHMGERVILRPGSYTQRSFHHHGFRYLMVTVREASADFKLGVRLNWVGYPLERKGSFASSDRELERIWETCAWTQQCCALDAYVDTPWREQAQWWGDARVQGWNTFALNGDTRLFRRGIRQTGMQTTPDGVTYGHAPTKAHECILPDFTLIWFLTIWDYYWQSGSVEPLLENHAVIQKALDYFRGQTDPRSGLATYDVRYWLFLDWTDIFKEGAPTVYNLWLLIALEKLALLYRKAKRPREAVPLEAWAKKLRAALGRLLDKDGLMRDGVDWKGKTVSSTSIHSQTLALIAGLKGIDEKKVMEKILLPYLRDQIKPKALPSAYWVTYLFTVLSERGHGGEVIEFIRKYWLPMVEHGTTWENFAPRIADESHSHAWSAHPLFHLMRIVGGVDQTGPVWKTVLFRPTFLGSENRTVTPTPHGPIISSWKRKEKGIEVELKLPAGITARVELPGEKPQTVTQGKKWVIGAKDAIA